MDWCVSDRVTLTRGGVPSGSAQRRTGLYYSMLAPVALHPTLKNALILSLEEENFSCCLTRQCHFIENKALQELHLLYVLKIILISSSFKVKIRMKRFNFIKVREKFYQESLHLTILLVKNTQSQDI